MSSTICGKRAASTVAVTPRRPVALIVKGGAFSAILSEKRVVGVEPSDSAVNMALFGDASAPGASREGNLLRSKNAYRGSGRKVSAMSLGRRNRSTPGTHIKSCLARGPLSTTLRASNSGSFRREFRRPAAEPPVQR